MATLIIAISAFITAWYGRQSALTKADAQSKIIEDLQDEIGRLKARLDVEEATKKLLTEELVRVQRRELRMAQRISQLEEAMRSAGVVIPPEEQD